MLRSEFRDKEGLRGSEVGLPLMISFTFTALFLKGCRQMGPRSSFCLESSSAQQIFGSPCLAFSLCASCSVWLVCPALHWELSLCGTADLPPGKSS